MFVACSESQPNAPDTRTALDIGIGDTGTQPDAERPPDAIDESDAIDATSETDSTAGADISAADTQDTTSQATPDAKDAGEVTLPTDATASDDIGDGALVDAAPDVGAADAPMTDVLADAFLVDSSGTEDLPITDTILVDTTNEAPPEVSSEDASSPVCTEICGDVNQDGTVDSADLTLLDAALAGDEPLDVCAQESADLKADEGLSPADRALLAAKLKGLVDTACVACSAPCGDVDGDGSVTVIDVEILTDAILQGIPYDGCTFWRSDVNSDGIVNVGDITALIDVINDLGGTLSCAP